jgi:hypothetical protein
MPSGTQLAVAPDPGLGAGIAGLREEADGQGDFRLQYVGLGVDVGAAAGRVAKRNELGDIAAVVGLLALVEPQATQRGPSRQGDVTQEDVTAPVGVLLALAFSHAGASLFKRATSSPGLRIATVR